MMRTQQIVAAAWHPPKWERADVAAIQALARGEADAEQQARALRWIVNSACATYEMPYRPEGDRDTAFYAGRIFAGQQIVKLTKIQLNKLKETA